MNQVLVMSPADADWAAWLPLLLPRSDLRCDDPRGECSAVVVINDRSAAAAHLLHRALDLRDARPQLPIAVLTPVQIPGHRLEALVRGLSPAQPEVELPASQVLAAIGSEAPPAHVHISPQAISFEFDA